MNEKKIKILQVIDILNVGGAEHIFVDMCNILYENNIDVSVLYILNGGVLKSELNPNIVSFELNRKNKWNLSSMYKCAKILGKFDISHCHLKHVYRYIFIVNFLFRVKSKLLIQDHGFANRKNKTALLFHKIIKPKFYIGVSKSLVDWAKSNLKIKSENIFFLPNIILKKDFIFENKEFDLILVSNIKPTKNNNFAIELVNKIDKKLVIIGNNHDNDYFEKICNLKNSNTEIIQNCTNAQEFIAKASFGLHTSNLETGPLVLIEYLAHGLPFLAYETGEIAKILKPHFPEYFIDNFDVDQWVEKIKLIKEAKVDCEKMNFVFNKYFSKEKYFNELTLIYKCILKN